MTLTIQLLIDWTFSMKLSHLLEQLPNLENYVKTLRSNEQLYTSPIVNTEDQDSTSSQEPPHQNQRTGNHEYLSWKPIGPSSYKLMTKPTEKWRAY